MTTSTTDAVHEVAKSFSGASASESSTSRDVGRARRRALGGRRLWWRWTAATEIGHIVGALLWALPANWLWFGPGEAGGPASTAAMFGLTMVAATVQGLVLGVAQGTVLRRVLPIPRGAWAVATCVGVAVGWLLLVVAAPRVDGLAREGNAFAPLVALGGAVFGAIVGGAQGIVLARHVRHVHRWVIASGVAWALALLLTVGVLQVYGGSGSSAVLVGAFAALVAGIVIGVVTATQLVRTVR